MVVDEDIDAGDLDQVLWAMCTRFDPLTDVDLVQKAWASKRDPLYLPGNSPRYFINAGLYSYVSIWLTPPSMNRKMQLFALHG